MIENKEKKIGENTTMKKLYLVISPGAKGLGEGGKRHPIK